MIRELLINQKNLKAVALIENNRNICFGELLEKSRMLEAVLSCFKQKNIAIFLPNGADFVSAFFGIIMAGKIAFPLNVFLTVNEVVPLLKQADAKIVVTSTKYRNFFEKKEEFYANSLKVIYIDEISALEKNKKTSKKISPNSPMMLFCTSGTTGNVKLVQLSETNIETSFLGYLDKLRFKKSECSYTRYILAMPFFSIYGIMIICACFLRGFPIIVLNGLPTLDSFYEIAAKHKATRYEGSASIILTMEQMAGRTITHDVSKLKYFAFGGSKVFGETIKKLQKAYPHAEFYQGYGMTEASPLLTKHIQTKIKKTNSVGTAIKGVELAIVENGKIVTKPNIIGEIAARGKNVMLGYYKNKKETKKIIRNGWLYTGDIGYLDKQGYLYVCGRKKSMVIVRGFKVFPEEVEDVLQNSGLVKECRAYGQKDDYKNETLCIDVVPKNSKISESEIRNYLRKNLAEYKQPKKIFFCDVLQRGATDKLKRH